MKRARPSSPCPDCARAHAFIADVIGGGPAVEPDVDDWIASLAALLDTALGHLLRDFDYAAKPDTPTASAARQMATKGAALVEQSIKDVAAKLN